MLFDVEMWRCGDVEIWRFVVMRVSKSGKEEIASYLAMTGGGVS
jgi:hypothetical protein